MFLTLILVTVGSQNNQAEAYRYHVGVLYDGREVFLPRKRRESPLNVGMKRRKNNLHYLSL